MLLQAFCGLRIREALALRERDVNFEAGTIRITETERHRPKNRFSFRSAARRIARWPAGARRSVGSHRAAVSSLRQRAHFPYLTLRATVDNARLLSGNETNDAAKRNQALRGYKPRWLRACFASAVLSVGADQTLVKEYMGHSQGDVLGLHYEQISIERLRSTIVPAIETWWHKSVTIEKPVSASPVKSPVHG